MTFACVRLGNYGTAVRLFTLVRQTVRLTVRYSDTDAAGIVHYAQYLAYLEAARAEALRSVGLDRESVYAFTLAAAVLDASLHYRAPARFDDPLDVTSWVTDISDTQFRWVYEIHGNIDHRLVLTAETVHCWLDAGPSWRPSSIPVQVIDTLQRLDGTSES